MDCLTHSGLCLNSITGYVDMLLKGLNIRNRLTVHNAFQMPSQVKIQGIKSGDQADHATGPPCPIQLLGKMLLRCQQTLMWKWAGAPSCCSHIVCCIAKGTFSSNGGSMFCRKVRYISTFRRCGSRTDPSRRSTIIPAHTLMLNSC